ncbi:hypothetical protein ABTW24_21650 [Sphingobacterium thalpophilum]|uniref:Uncharacterized protein n=1 Tax=Sphingobacterium thalpophilum TaxID=259 RepID=A0ABV4HI35_9SPHI|nr:hypothetical protein [Sphingobacterium thalpophilum]
MENLISKTWKCRATGKVAFPSLMEAKWRMFQFKVRSRIKNKLDGKRIKHRMGRYACKRAYYCPYCGGYHITKWKKADYERYKNLVMGWNISSSPSVSF